MKFFLFLFYVFSGLYCEIIEVDSLQKADKVFQDLQKDDLVLFDVDFTLIVSDDVILRPIGQTLIRVTEILADPSFNTSRKYTPVYLHSQIIRTTKSSLVENHSSDLVRNLQKRKIPTIGFTAVMSGKFGVIDNLADFRIEELKSLGLNFANAFPQIKTLEFPKAEGKEHPPIYKSGILFSSKHPKGDVLKQFLEAIQWYPKKVVFIDDHMTFLQSVEIILKEMKIDFIGLHYVAAKKLPCTLNKELAEFQFRYLVDHGTWLIDEEAQLIMDRKNDSH